jgi:catechol 2,3-dioxygenase-like lactoylglutathione lyase family enzyme
MRILIGSVLTAISLCAQQTPQFHFHHIHLNSTDPAAAIAFYTSKLDCEKENYGADEAIRAENSWILFTKVTQPPPSDIVSAIWHFGWGAEDMKSVYQKQLDSGTKFNTPITDISDLAGRPPGSFFFAYIDGPDHALIEINTASHHHFGHLHLLSEDPVAAAEWYKKHFGFAGSVTRESRLYRGVHVSPAASFMIDGVSVIIFPVEYARDAMPGLWRNRKSFEPTAGRVVDHIAFGVNNLPVFLDRLRRDGIEVTSTNTKSAFIEGPDKIRIELIQEP